MPSSPVRSFFLIAGEPSGDFLGARLMRALQARGEAEGVEVRFRGIGGEKMRAAGLEVFFPQEDLAHVGLIEVLRHLPTLARRLKATVAEVRREPPDALITIDSPDFCLRVAKRLRKGGAPCPLVHYVAPSVWAWRPGRAKALAGVLDHLMTVLPFEPPYFTREGLACTFVGHPLVESNAGKGRAERIFARWPEAREGGPFVVVLPGSRRSEVARLEPIFRATLAYLKTRYPTLKALVPTLGVVASAMEERTKTWPVPTLVVHGENAKYDALAAGTVALACSGTVSLELALAGLPSVIAYKVHPLTALIARRLIRCPFATLVNLMQGRAVMPELLQEKCTPHALAEAVAALLDSPKARATQREALADVAPWLGRDGPAPSVRAAEVVWGCVKRPLGGSLSVNP